MSTRNDKPLLALALPLLGALLLAPALAAHAQAQAIASKPAQPKAQTSAQAAPSIVVDLSSATLSELTKLPG
ncbi:MAG: hypothetical protein ACHQ53_12740, partial [Polyangiales bacterium]